MASKSDTMRTPLNKVRGLGSAGSGTEHFWHQRLSALANVPLILFFVGVIISGVGADHARFTAMMGSPIVSALFILFIVSGVFHMRLGMQIVIEDYVHSEGSKILCLLANTFFSILIALIGVISVLMVAFSS